jgi:hypothetical protein
MSQNGHNRRNGGPSPLNISASSVFSVAMTTNRYQSHPLAQKLLEFIHADICRNDQHGGLYSGILLLPVLHVVLYKSSKERKKEKLYVATGVSPFKIETTVCII